MDPDTGRRRSRPRKPSELVVAEVPELRIIGQELWDAAKARQKGLDCRIPTDRGTGPAPFWSKQRPRYLFSGLVRCGSCGGGFSMNGLTHLSCSTARNKGPVACDNRLTIRRSEVESAVLDGLAHRVMDPDQFKVFVAQFTTEWNRLQSEVGADLDAWQADLARVTAQIGRLVDAIANGTPPASINGRIAELEKRRKELETSIAGTEAPAPRLHPNLAEVYRQTVSSLIEVPAQDDGAEAREMIRRLIETITLLPENGKLRVEIRGELASILSLSAARRAPRTAGQTDTLAQQVKMVAGTRNPLCRTTFAARLRRSQGISARRNPKKFPMVIRS